MLHVGSFEKRKDLITLVKAFHVIKKQVSNKKIKIVLEGAQIVKGNKKDRIILLSTDNKTLGEVRVIDSRLTEKQKESPLTIEAMDIIAIKETPAANFYDGLGALKGVDITAASLGFKIINTIINYISI